MKTSMKQIDFQNPLLREEGQRESQRLSPPDVSSYGGRRNQAVQLQAGRTPELGRETARATGKSAEAQKSMRG